MRYVDIYVIVSVFLILNEHIALHIVGRKMKCFYEGTGIYHGLRSDMRRVTRLRIVRHSPRVFLLAPLPRCQL